MTKRDFDLPVLVIFAFAFLLFGGLVAVYLLAPQKVSLATLFDPAYVLIVAVLTGFLLFGYLLGDRLA